MMCACCQRRERTVLTWCSICAYGLFHGRFGAEARIRGFGTDPS